MEAARTLSLEWIAAWNARDLEAVLSHYEPDVEFESPRVAAAYVATGGQVGSPDGVLRGVDSLRPYFSQAIDHLPHLHLEFLQMLEGPPGGWFAVQYRRETGAVVLETFRLTPAPAPAATVAERGAGAEQRPSRIAAVRVFYEAVC
ncbi:hypothetical protein GPECTOR_29g62 [Gonium pectorale]|uniref:SnoaL-like domain-containing protein n=1 Tax=Gonium pectorale TaxID=33097 RepID=A0A150GEN1_GONPE|nr:hypothetical protein GPECTOR_29g62 [Gonium pectorale]|eukprot:KXZ48286.1 hypothetical protein GPECTOR_29g62 [Gonium pectorale]